MVLWSKVDSSTIAVPTEPETFAIRVPKSSLSFRTTSKVKLPSTPGIPSKIGTDIFPSSSVSLNSSPIKRGLNNRWTWTVNDWSSIGFFVSASVKMGVT